MAGLAGEPELCRDRRQSRLAVSVRPRAGRVRSMSWTAFRPRSGAVLDELAGLFIASGLRRAVADHRHLQEQGLSAVAAAAVPVDADGFVHRPLKTLLPEQVFDSLEQALGLPIAKADNGPRFNGERDQFVARMNEAAPDTPGRLQGRHPAGPDADERQAHRRRDQPGDAAARCGPSSRRRFCRRQRRSRRCIWRRCHAKADAGGAEVPAGRTWRARKTKPSKSRPMPRFCGACSIVRSSC